MNEQLLYLLSGVNERLLRLFPGVNERLLRLLSGDRSWDCTANLSLHRHRSATSGKASRIECLFQLVTAQPVPPALVPPWGTL